MNAKKYLARTFWIALFIGLGAGLVPLLSNDADEGKEKAPLTIQLKEDLSPMDREAVGQMPASYATVIDKAAPSVVNIFTTKRMRRPRNPFQNDPFFERFFRGPGPRREPEEEQPEYQQRSLGSGVIVTEDGYVLTNNHVVANADEIRVALEREKREFTARVIGTDEKTDLAVLKIEGKDFPAIRTGNSADTRVGDVVFAIGNPFGVGQTVTKGIISAKGRAVGMIDYEDFIQTDAAINPGNSGGALIDAKGRLIGINTAIVSRSGGSQGIGFAIPMELVKKIIQPLLTDGKVTRGFLGVSIQDITAELQNAFGLDTAEGTLVTNVMPNSAAERAGVEKGDVIVSLNGKPVRDVQQLRLLVAEVAPGSKVSLEVIRKGTLQTLEARLKTQPDDELAGASRPDNGGESLLRGVQLQELSQAHRQRLNAPDSLTGLVVMQVRPASPAANAGLIQADVITQIDQQDIRSVEDARKILNKVKERDLLIHVWRRGGGMFMVIRDEAGDKNE